MSVQPARPEPIFNIPRVVLGLLVVMIAIQFGRGLLGSGTDDRLVSWFAFVPGRLTFAFDPVGVMKHLAADGTAAAPNLRAQSLWAQLFLQRGGAAPWTLLTYAFLHGGWMHLGLNGVWMVAFGTPVARRFGSKRFLVFMAVTAVFGALAHWLCFPFGFAPVVGASAGISGLMGAAVRFMFQGTGLSPDIRDVTPLSLTTVFKDRRTLPFILVWFASNSLFGLGAGTLGLSDAPIAWQAHVGGFVAGLLLFPWFDPVPARRLDEPGATEPDVDAATADIEVPHAVDGSRGRDVTSTRGDFADLPPR